MKKATLLLIALTFAGCGYFDKKEESPDNIGDVNDLRAEFDAQKHRLGETADENGWIVNDCDGFEWNGLFAAVGGTPDLYAAEIEPGKFHRRPSGNCSYTWSRDMCINGMLPYALMTRDRQILEDHAAYGEANKVIDSTGVPAWQMGEPLGDLRTVYTPSLIGIIYEAIAWLGGPDNTQRGWPPVYPSGLDDFKAMLQMREIWARSYTSTNGDLAQIRRVAFERIEEHAAREPDCPFYEYMHAKYTDGDFQDAINLLLANPGAPACQSIRCDGSEACFQAEWLWAAKLVLSEFE